VSTEVQRQTHPAFDVTVLRHRRALFVWLNAWGCRQFSKRHHELAGRSLLSWARTHLPHLPLPEVSLLNLKDIDLDRAARAYGNLTRRRAGLRAGRSRQHPVTYGPTGAAKTLFALRPKALPMWDDGIRKHFEADGSVASYRHFLEETRETLRFLVNDARRLHIRPNLIPERIGRPDSSLVKLIDEYNWIVITQDVTPPGLSDLERWVTWARI
jgi:hypothetical protein